MPVNFVVQPNVFLTHQYHGKGFVTGYNATYANFCGLDGIYLDILNSLTASFVSSGIYTINTTNTTNLITGVICQFRFDDTATNTYAFYAYITSITPGVSCQVQVIDCPGNEMIDGDGLSIAEIDAWITNTNNDRVNLSCYVGGAAGTPEDIFELCKLGASIAMVEDGTYTPSTGTADLTGLTIVGVKSDGTIARNYSDKPLLDYYINAVVNAFSHASGTTSRLTHSCVRIKPYSASGVTTSVVYRPDDSYSYTISINSDIESPARNTCYYNLGNTGIDTREYGYSINSTYSNLYRFMYSSAGSRTAYNVTGGHINATYVADGRYSTSPSIVLCNTVIACDRLFDKVGSANWLSNCTIITINDTSPAVAGGSDAVLTKFENCLFAGWSEIIDTTVDDAHLFSCMYYDSNLGDTQDADWQNNQELLTDPFVNSASDDYRVTPTSGLYDSDTGRILAGALGPELTSGVGGGVSSSRIFGGL